MQKLKHYSIAVWIIISTDKVSKVFRVFKDFKVIKEEKKTKFEFIMSEALVPHRGNYKKLFSYQKSDVIFQLTYYFCNNYLQRGDRTIDQMVQAARSGKQNIVEGCMASATSAKTEIKLLNVAKASLQELLEDFEDYLKTRGHRQWEEGSVELEAMRRVGKEHNDGEFFMQLVQTCPPETIANMAIVLIKQADFLLHRQIQRLAEEFTVSGGFSERMTRIRKEYRGK